MHKLTLVLALLSLITVAPRVWADIYKVVDADGNVTFTNVPVKGGTRIVADPLSTISTSGNAGREEAPARRSSGTRSSGGGGGGAGAPAARSGGERVTPPSPAGFPRVNADEQRSRDSNRRRILEEELAGEQKLLDAARKALAQAEGNKTPEEKADPSKFLARIGRLRESVVMHEKNIAALQKELSRVR